MRMLIGQKVVGKPSASDLATMGEDCKMAEDGIGLLSHVNSLRGEESTITQPLLEVIAIIDIGCADAS